MAGVNMLKKVTETKLREYLCRKRRQRKNVEGVGEGDR